MVWLIILGIVLLIAAVAGIAYLVARKKEKAEPLTFRHAVNVAKALLQDSDNKPEIFTKKKGQEPLPFDALALNKKKAELPGTYLLRWPELEIIYSCKSPAEKINLKLADYPEDALAIYHEGLLAAVELAGNVLDMEDFQMRHAGTIAEQMRSMVRYHLRFPGGTLTIDKAPEPTFKPTLDLRKPGELKLKGSPPPEKMPGFED